MIIEDRLVVLFVKSLSYGSQTPIEIDSFSIISLAFTSTRARSRRHFRHPITGIADPQQISW